MVDYENLYHIMVRTVEIALENLKAGNVWDAARKLEMGEQICEEIYIATAEDNPQPPTLSLIKGEMSRGKRSLLVVLTEEDITISPVPSECLGIWGKTLKQVLNQATENAQTFSQIYLSLIASPLHNYRSSSIPFNSDREAREAKKQIGNKIDVLLVKSLYEGSVSLLLPGTQARLANLFGGDYYVSLLTADTCVVHSIKDMDIDQLMDSIDSAGSETPYGTLSRYPLKYDSKRKIMKVIKRQK